MCVEIAFSQVRAVRSKWRGILRVALSEQGIIFGEAFDVPLDEATIRDNAGFLVG